MASARGPVASIECSIVFRLRSASSTNPEIQARSRAPVKRERLPQSRTASFTGW
jgi:hypothetical protein